MSGGLNLGAADPGTLPATQQARAAGLPGKAGGALAQAGAERSSSARPQSAPSGGWTLIAQHPNSVKAEAGWFNFAYDTRRHRLYGLDYRGWLWAFDLNADQWSSTS